jgi:pimeloyl-ACP methyl ester carboxylesterase
MRTASGVHVTVWGDGEPAVFVHGSFGWGKETWKQQRPLADHYRLLLVDRRGFGASPANGRVDFERDAEDVAELLGDGAHLVGHSYGGVVSLLAAGRRPGVVRSLTLIEPPAFGVARGIRLWRSWSVTSGRPRPLRPIRPTIASVFCTGSAFRANRFSSKALSTRPRGPR